MSNIPRNGGIQSIQHFFIIALCLIGLSACGGGSIGKAWTSGGKCQALSDWTAKIDREFPNGNFSQFANLFRDKYFEPVFDVTYREMTNESKIKIQTDVLRKCTGASENKYAGLLNSIFGGQEGQQIVSLVGTLQNLEGQMLEVLEKTKNLSPTEENFSTLQNHFVNGTKNFADLFPSEVNAFSSTIQQRRSDMSEILLAKTANEIDGLESSLENAHKLKHDIIPQTAKYTKALKYWPKKKLAEIADQKLQTIIADVVNERLAVLKTVPPSQEGLRESKQWYESLQRDFSPYEGIPVVGEARSEFKKKREEILQATKSEFFASLTALNPSYENLQKTNELF